MNRYQFGKKTDMDDVLKLSFRVQITDHVLNVHGAVCLMTFKATSYGGVITDTGSVTIQLTGNEQASMDTIFWGEEFQNSQKTSG